MIKTPPAPRIATIYCSGAIFVFGLLALIIPSGYSIGAGLLLIGGLYAYTQERHSPLDPRDLVLFLLLAAFTLEGIANILWHDLSSRHYDKVLRFIFAIPVFYLIRWAKPSLHWVWAGLIGGSVAAGSLAVYEKFILNVDRASGFLHAIQFGNLSILLGLFCLAGLGWAAAQQKPTQRKIYVVLLLIGAASGLLGSILSGSRGGWVGLPFVLFVLFKAYHSFFSWRTKIIVIALALLTGISLYHTPQLPIKSRIYDAVSDIQKYRLEDKNTSVGARFEMWRGAVALIKEKPILGWGQNGYVEGMQQLIARQYVHPRVQIFDHAHNEILDKTAKHGIVGLLALLALYLVPIWYFNPYLKHPNLSIRAVAVAGTLLPVAYLDFGLTQGFLSHNSGVTTYPFWLMVWTGYLRNAFQAQPLACTAPAATAP